MKEFWWKLPGLRGLSPMGRGVTEAFALAFVLSVLFGVGFHRALSHPTKGLCSSLAQIGATLLVAYAVQMAWVLQASRKRGAQRENWVGAMSGVGASALLGIGWALYLSNHSSRLSWIEGIGFTWALISTGLLGLWIALQPWAMYHWTHWFNTQYPDE